MTQTPVPVAAQRIAIIGAGPIGLESALYAATLGHDVVVYEQGDLAAAVQAWRHIQLFSPWAMNVTPLGLATLAAMGQPLRGNLDDRDRPPGAGDFVDQYLRPLSQSPRLQGRIRTGRRVLAVGRPTLLKGDLIGQAARGARGFRLLLAESPPSAPPGDCATATESIATADVVIDCSGTFFHPAALGDGGIPALGERALTDRITHRVPDLAGRDRARFAGRRVLVVGAGHSAATAITLLSDLAMEHPTQAAHVTWVTRGDRPLPYAPQESDPLPTRRRLHQAANGAIGQPHCTLLAGHVVHRVAPAADGGVTVDLRPTASAPTDSTAFRHIVVDEILALTGYGPDRSIYEQLQIHECYASLGPMKLAATLLGATGDCLAQPLPGRDTLKNPEPGFFILGAKSYGRGSAFLLQIGHAQVRSLFQLLHGQSDLDLYATTSS